MDAGESLMEGHQAWEDYISICDREDRRTRHYRLDITMKDLPELDDPTSIPMLKALVYNDKQLRKVISGMAEHLFASLFCFELTEAPVEMGGDYRVAGKLLCLRPGDDPALPRIIQRMLGGTIRVNKKKVMAVLCQDEHGCIYQRLSFTSSKKIDIEISPRGFVQKRRISGSPYRLAQLVGNSRIQHGFNTRVSKRKAAEQAHPSQRPTKRLMTCQGCR